MIPYPSSLYHLLAEMERIDLLIRAQVWRARYAYSAETDGETDGETGGDADLHPFYISEEEVTRLLAQPAGLPRWAALDAPWPPDDLRAALNTMSSALDRRRAASRERGVVLRLDELARRFRLSTFEVDALLICLAPELDLRYERLYAYLQDNVTHKCPTVDLVLNLLCPSFDAKLAARRSFAPGAPLLHYDLLVTQADPAEPLAPLPARRLKLDERVAAYLLEQDEPDPRLLPSVKLVTAPRGDDLSPPIELIHRLAALTQTPEGPRLYYFHGPPGAGKQAAAMALAAELGRPLLWVDGAALVAATDPPLAVRARWVLREARLQDALLYWQDADLLLAPEQTAARAALLAALADPPAPVILAGDGAWDATGELPGLGPAHSGVPVEFVRPSAAERSRLWTQALHGAQTNGAQPADSSLEIDALAAKFRFTPGQIRAAAAQARRLAQWRDPQAAILTAADLDAACRRQAHPKLGGVARKVAPHYTWDDIILPADRMQQLREICNQVNYRGRVHDSWGFGHKLALGKGLSVLFAGPSGTGKTMAAGILANDLGLDLYQIDLAGVVSKYIGETEKNLARIFAEAEDSNAILFFDEADALFGKRSEVRDAHDRYANLEISYLLQRMEAYEGIAILATNLHKNMDDAFVRRMQFTVDFPFPGVHDRRRIWEKIWPERLPRSPALDLDFMAACFELAGGHIRNIALASAFLAAADDPETGAQPAEQSGEQRKEVEMRHLIRATQREYQKMGKLILAGDFGPYAQYLG